MKQKSIVRSSTVTTKTKEARKAQEALAVRRRHNAALMAQEALTVQRNHDDAMKVINALDEQRPLEQERAAIVVARDPHPPVPCARPPLMSGESEQPERSAKLIAASLSSLFVGACILGAAFLASGGPHQ